MDGSLEKITEGRLVYRALTGMNGKPHFAIAARARADWSGFRQ
jgi:hypothetical protein